MSKALAKQIESVSSVINWNDPAMQRQIREAYGSKLSDSEWNMFLAMGKATRLNPFLREIYAVKYGTSPASVFIGRDGYRRSAQANPEYDYHSVDAVYSNDTFENNDGIITHKYNLKDRGELLGAYCIVKRKSATKQVVNFVELKEYRQSYGTWKDKPATMIKKVAEAQGLRANFQELFAGTYEESEDMERKSNSIDLPKAADLIAKIEHCKTDEELSEVSNDVAKSMAHLSDAERKKIMDTGKKMRLEFLGKIEVKEKLLKNPKELSPEEKEAIRKLETEEAEAVARQEGMGF